MGRDTRRHHGPSVSERVRPLAVPVALLVAAGTLGGALSLAAVPAPEATGSMLAELRPPVVPVAAEPSASPSPSPAAGARRPSPRPSATRTVRATSHPVAGKPSKPSAPPAPPAPFVLRINAGGPALVDGGLDWIADKHYVGGDVGLAKDPVTSATPLVDSDERWRPEAYRIPVPRSGEYVLRLHLTEIYWTAPRKRVFDIAVEGSLVASQLDIFAFAGRGVTRIVEVPVQVTDGELTVTFIDSVNHATITALEVLERV